MKRTRTEKIIQIDIQNQRIRNLRNSAPQIPRFQNLFRRGKRTRGTVQNFLRFRPDGVAMNRHGGMRARREVLVRKDARGDENARTERPVDMFVMAQQGESGKNIFL